MFRLLLSLPLVVPAFFILGIGCSNSAAVEQRIRDLEARQVETNTVAEQTRDSVEDLRLQASDLESQAAANNSAISQIPNHVEDLSDEVSDLNSQVGDISKAINQLSASMQSVNSEIAKLAAAANAESDSLPLFNIDVTENEANQLLLDCLIGRMEGLFGSVGSVFSRSFAEEFPLSEFVGFSDGDMSATEEIMFLGAFFGCWSAEFP